MIANSQLAQLNNPGMQPCSATTVEHACARCQDQTGALHMFATQMSPKAVWSRRLRNMQDESVLVVGELLCTGVQANTERHTRKETREMCSCWGYKQHSRVFFSARFAGHFARQPASLEGVGQERIAHACDSVTTYVFVSTGRAAARGQRTGECSPLRHRTSSCPQDPDQLFAPRQSQSQDNVIRLRQRPSC